MDLTPKNTKITHSDTPRTYRITIRDVEANEVMQEYDTKIAIIFGLKEGSENPETGLLDINSIHVGTAEQVAQLLAVVNNTVVAYLQAAWQQSQKLMSKGDKAD